MTNIGSRAGPLDPYGSLGSRSWSETFWCTWTETLWRSTRRSRSWFDMIRHIEIDVVCICQSEFQDPKMELRSYHIFGHILGVYPGMAIEFVCWSFTMDVSIIDFVLPGTRLRDGLGDFPGEGGAEKYGTSHSKTEVWRGTHRTKGGFFHCSVWLPEGSSG